MKNKSGRTLDFTTNIFEYPVHCPEKEGDRYRWVLTTYRRGQLVVSSITRVIVERPQPDDPFTITRWLPFSDPRATLTASGPHKRVTDKVMREQHEEAVEKALHWLRVNSGGLDLYEDFPKDPSDLTTFRR